MSNFRDYILESTKYMYDDNYIVESKFELNGKEYASKKAAEQDLKKKGLKGTKLADALNRGKMIKVEKKESNKYEQKHLDMLNDIHRKITNRLTTTIRRRISSISELGFNSNKNIWY
jgi:hypothetical protein